MNRTTDNALVETISPRDQMAYPGREHYFHSGRSAMACIRAGLEEAGREGGGAVPFGVRRILDLPCGHGRVLRHLRHAFPSAEITACDINRDGVDFCAETFGAIPVYSHDDPERIPVPRGYFDLIWVGSLFTHVEVGAWRSFLKLFRESLAPGGILIFTTAGRQVRDYMAAKLFDGHGEAELEELVRAYDQEGYGHAPYGGTDESYGTSIAAADWVVDRIMEADGLRLVMHAARAWDGRQDCYTCRRGEPRGAVGRSRSDDQRPASIARRALRLFSTAGSRRVRVSG